MGYSPCGAKELDTTEQLALSEAKLLQPVSPALAGGFFATEAPAMRSSLPTKKPGAREETLFGFGKCVAGVGGRRKAGEGKWLFSARVRTVVLKAECIPPGSVSYLLPDALIKQQQQQMVGHYVDIHV